MNLKSKYKHIAIKRIAFSTMIIVIYIIGSNITLPGVDSRELIKIINSTPNAAFATSMTGMSLNNFSFFSIGLGPWISSLILWRVLTSIKVFKLDNLTKAQGYRFKFIFSMFFGAIQALGIISKVELDNGSLLSTLTVLLQLMAGLALLVWLGNQNSMYGVGGSLVIIMTNMSRQWIESIMHYLTHQTLDFDLVLKILFWFVLCSVFIHFVLFFMNGQLRLPVMHVMLDNKYSKESYLPISVYPAGGMPLMYTFSIDMLLQYIFAILTQIYKNNQIIDYIYGHLTYDTLIGVLVVIVIMLFLNYGFAYVNVDNQSIAKNFQKSGDYFPNVYPGKNTEVYLSNKILRMATVGAIFNVLTVGIPMIASVYYTGTSLIYRLIPMLIMWIILLLEMIRQFRTSYNMGDYEDVTDFQKDIFQ